MKFSQLIFEKAVSINDETAKNAGLLISGITSGFNVILYDPEKLRDKLETHRFSRTETALYGFAVRSVYAAGMMIKSAGVPFDAYMVKFSGAVKNGYGPLLYDIMISLAGSKGLCADKRMLSDDAKRVWKKYLSDRNHEYKNIPIDDRDVPLTPDKSDDGIIHKRGLIEIGETEAYDRIWYIKDSLNIRPLTNNSDQFLTEYPFMLPIFKDKEFPVEIFKKAVNDRH